MCLLERGDFRNKYKSVKCSKINLLLVRQTCVGEITIEIAVYRIQYVMSLQAMQEGLRFDDS